jgi:hypothetical protein
MQKFVGSLFFTWDDELRCPTTGEIPICNSSDLNEELGQVSTNIIYMKKKVIINFVVLGPIFIYGQDWYTYGKQYGIPTVLHRGSETRRERGRPLCSS